MSFPGVLFVLLENLWLVEVQYCGLAMLGPVLWEYLVSMLNIEVQVLVIQTLIVSLLLKLAQESNHGTSVSLDSDLRENSSEHKLIVLWRASSIFLKNWEVGRPLLSFIDFN